MTRLTKEREQEIRAINEHTPILGELNPMLVRDELLAEIDALREDIKDNELGYMQIRGMDALQIEHLAQDDTHVASALVEKQISGGEHILHERIAKLREVIVWASPCGQPWIREEHHPTYDVIGKAMREALAQDDEMDSK